MQPQEMDKESLGIRVPKAAKELEMLIGYGWAQSLEPKSANEVQL